MKDIQDIKKKVMSKATKTLVKEVLNFSYVLFANCSEVDIVKLPWFNSVAKIEFNRDTPELNIFCKDFSEKAYEISKLYKKTFNDDMSVNHIY
jgi:hypothetical protein